METQTHSRQKANIFFCLPFFDKPWCVDELKKYIKPEMNVLIAALAFDWDMKEKEWNFLYGVGGAFYYSHVHPYAAFGINEDHIKWLNYFKDTHETSLEKISKADIILFTGGLPDAMFKRIQDLGIQKELEEFPGILMGYSAGAMVQISYYHITPDEDYPTYMYAHGLNIVKDFDLEVHYEGKEIQNEGTQRAIQERHLPVYQMPNDSAIILSEGKLTLLGNIKLVQ